MEDREKMMLQGCHWYAGVDYGNRVPARLENSENGSAEIFPRILGKANLCGWDNSMELGMVWGDLH